MQRNATVVTETRGDPFAPGGVPEGLDQRAECSSHGPAGAQAIKLRILSRCPRAARTARYAKALFRGESELRLLPWLCDASRVTIDVGAHHGTYTLGASRYSRRVTAVEPQPGYAAALRNAVPLNTTLVEAALSNRSGEGLLKVPLADQNSGMARLDFDDRSENHWREQRVTLMRLDDIALEPVGFVKIDVEGHELEVLEGAAGIIVSDRPNFLIEIEERHRPGSLCDVSRYLHHYGYSGYFVLNGEIRPLSEFDVATHQDPLLIGNGHRATYSDYINNFIFLPPMVDPPSMVPSPWRALRSFVSETVNRNGSMAIKV
jgi:FkbM family methyltransferase